VCVYVYVWYNGDADIQALWYDNGRGYGRPKLLVKQELKADHAWGRGFGKERERECVCVCEREGTDLSCREICR
jgi:hypothetical protein